MISQPWHCLSKQVTHHIVTPVSSVRGPPRDLECPGEHRRLTGGRGQAAGLGVGVLGRLVTLVAVDGCIFVGFDAFDELFEKFDLVG